MTYITLKKITQNRNLPIVEKNSCGKKVMIDSGTDDGDNFFKLLIPIGKKKCKIQKYYSSGKTTEEFSTW